MNGNCRDCDFFETQIFCFFETETFSDCKFSNLSRLRLFRDCNLGFFETQTFQDSAKIVETETFRDSAKIVETETLRDSAKIVETETLVDLWI